MKFKNVLKSVAFLVVMGTITTIQYTFALRNTFIDYKDQELFTETIEKDLFQAIDTTKDDNIHNLIINIPSIIEQSIKTIHEKHTHDLFTPTSEKFKKAPVLTIFHDILISYTTSKTELKIIFKQDSDQKYKLFTVINLLKRFISKIATFLSFRNHESYKHYFYPNKTLEISKVLTLVKTLINTLQEKDLNLFTEIEEAAKKGIEQFLNDLPKSDILYTTLNNVIHSDIFQKNYNSSYSILILSQYTEASFPKEISNQKPIELSNILNTIQNTIPQRSNNAAAKSLQDQLDLYKRKVRNRNISLATILPITILAIVEVLRKDNEDFNKINYKNCTETMYNAFGKNCDNSKVDTNSNIYTGMQDAVKIFCKSQKTNTDKNYEKNFKTYINNKSPKPRFIGKYNCKF